MYKNAINRIEKRFPINEISSCLAEKRVLVIVKVSEISDLVYLDTEGVRLDFDSRLSGTMLVLPGSSYEIYRNLSDELRMRRKKGVFYASARHSEDLAIALFEDESNRIDNNFFEKIILDLRLITEMQDPSKPLRPCNPFSEKLHQTMGYYKFSPSAKFEHLKSSGILNPLDIPREGLVDFVRRNYKKYPADAVIKK
jgi:hypothetical protein